MITFGVDPRTTQHRCCGMLRPRAVYSTDGPPAIELIDLLVVIDGAVDIEPFNGALASKTLANADAERPLRHAKTGDNLAVVGRGGAQLSSVDPVLSHLHGHQRSGSQG